MKRLTLMSALLCAGLCARDLTWSGGNWNMADASWRDAGGNAATFASGDNVTFAKGGSLTLTASVSPGDVTFDIPTGETLTLAINVGAFRAPVPHASWSVEGYFKNDAGGMFCRMGEVGCGWQLDYEPSQTRFSLVAAPDPQCAKCTSGTFLATAVMPGDLNHLLLTFDTSADLPVWRLYVNGKTAGSVTNIWSGVGTNYRGMFALGSGEFDLWRVSNGIVDVLDSLYQSPPGMSVIFR